MNRCALRQRFGDENQAIYEYGRSGSTTDPFPSTGHRTVANSLRFGPDIATKAAPFAPVKPEGGLVGEVRELLGDMHTLVERTRLAVHEQLPIAQAYLQAGPLTSITDILEPREGGWFLWEVKASTSVKPVHEWDLAFQVEVARQAGIPVVGCGVVHLDAAYVRGPDLEPRRLLVTPDCTAAVRSHELDTRREIAVQLGVLAQGTAPPAVPSSHCKASRDVAAGNRPSTCGHLDDAGFCGAQLPKHWAGHLPRLSPAKWAEIRAMSDPSIQLLDPAEHVGNRDKWTPDQQRCIRAVRTGSPEVDVPALQGELGNLRWPVAYVDFEFDTGMAVPRYRGSRPYDVIPFQWSMHLQEVRGGPLIEREPFLHPLTTDPRALFAESLLGALPAEGSIVAHHADAEIRVTSQLADRLGGQVAARLRALVPRFFDTETLARAGYYSAGQKGSWSIKKLAPALLGKGYEGLSIQNGMAAVAEWKIACGETDPSVRDRLRADLLAYCGRDTALMHDVVERLRTLAGVGP